LRRPAAPKNKKFTIFYFSTAPTYDIITLIASVKQKQTEEGLSVKNRVTVTIANQEYTLVATEDAAYMEKVAHHVDAKLREVLEGSKVSTTEAAVLAALNVADEYFKEVEAAENLRGQLKEYLEEATDLKMQLSEAKREIFKLQNKKS